MGTVYLQLLVRNDENEVGNAYHAKQHLVNSRKVMGEHGKFCTQPWVGAIQLATANGPKEKMEEDLWRTR